jgi:hypothetical protein
LAQSLDPAVIICLDDDRRALTICGGIMDYRLYNKYLVEFVREAIRNSDGSVRGISEALAEKQIGKFMVQHKDEKLRALADARKAFEEHRHWPLNIVLSHLGVNLEDEGSGPAVGG